MAAKDKDSKDIKDAKDAADPEEQAEGQAAPKRKLPPLKWIIIGAAALLSLSGAGAGAYFFLGARNSSQAVAAPVKPAAFLDMPDVLVNLANPGTDRTQYLKVKITLELPEQAMVAQVQPVLPRVMDAFQTYLRELRSTDLEGSAGLYRLKEELTRRVNASIAPNRVSAVLFKEIVVQ